MFPSRIRHDKSLKALANDSNAVGCENVELTARLYCWREIKNLSKLIEQQDGFFNSPSWMKRDTFAIYWRKDCLHAFGSHFFRYVALHVDVLVLTQETAVRLGHSVQNLNSFLTVLICSAKPLYRWLIGQNILSYRKTLFNLYPIFLIGHFSN
jgi:hypothetical protein